MQAPTPAAGPGAPPEQPRPLPGSGQFWLWLLFGLVTFADAAYLGWIVRIADIGWAVGVVQDFQRNPLLGLLLVETLALRVGAVIALLGPAWTQRPTLWLALVPFWGAPFLFAELLQRSVRGVPPFGQRLSRPSPPDQVSASGGTAGSGSSSSSPD